MGKKILVVDDEPHMVRGIQFNLEKAGYSILTAENGQEALQILQKEKVDLVIADVMMPKIDGLELCRRIKADSRWKSYPVIMLTAKAQLKDRVSGREAGADNYITKPFHPRELVATVENTLKLSGTEEIRQEKQIRSNLEKYLSPNVVNQIRKGSGKLRLGGVQKRVTVLYSDIRGFTSVAEKMEPIDVTNMLNEYFSTIAKEVFKNEGTLDKYIGDSIMAIFGAPFSHKDDALRAVKTAIGMRKQLIILKKKWKKEGKVLFDTGIGINTGDVIAGNIGSRKQMGYTVVGDAVNLAKRLTECAKGGEILIGRATFLEVRDEVKQVYLKAVELEPTKVKGKSKPIQVYKLLDVKKKEKVDS